MRRYLNLIKRGIDAVTARRLAGNGRGSWKNAKATSMNLAFPKKYFDSYGLVSLLDMVLSF